MAGRLGAGHGALYGIRFAVHVPKGIKEQQVRFCVLLRVGFCANVRCRYLGEREMDPNSEMVSGESSPAVEGDWSSGHVHML